MILLPDYYIAREFAFYLIYPHLAHCTAEVCTEAFGSLELAVYIEVREDERVCLFCSDSLS